MMTCMKCGAEWAEGEVCPECGPAVPSPLIGVDTPSEVDMIDPRASPGALAAEVRRLRAQLAEAKAEIDLTYKEWCGSDYMHLPLHEAVGAGIFADRREKDAARASLAQSRALCDDLDAECSKRQVRIYKLEAELAEERAKTEGESPEELDARLATKQALGAGCHDEYGPIVDCYSCGHYSEMVSGCDPIMPKCEGHKYWVKRARPTPDATELREALEKAAKCLQTIALGPWRDLGLESIVNIRDYAHTNTIIARAALRCSSPAAGKEQIDEAYKRGYSNGYARRGHDDNWDKVEANL